MQHSLHVIAALIRQRKTWACNSSSVKDARKKNKLSFARGKESEKTSTFGKYFLALTRVFQTEWEELKPLVKLILLSLIRQV